MTRDLAAMRACEAGDMRLVHCDECGSEGRIYTMSGNDPDSERDHGPCSRCEGTGMMLVEVEPITMEDLP